MDFLISGRLFAIFSALIEVVRCVTNHNVCFTNHLEESIHQCIDLFAEIDPAALKEVIEFQAIIKMIFSNTLSKCHWSLGRGD